MHGGDSDLVQVCAPVGLIAGELLLINGTPWSQKGLGVSRLVYR